VKRPTLAVMAVAALASAAAYFAFDPPPAGATPQRLRELGPWLEQHPADWIASSIVVDKALDSTLPQRDPLWRAAYAHSQLLAPYRDTPHLSLLRSGLSHWFELGDADRRVVLANAAPLLTDPDQFRKLHRAIWEVTGDFALLRRSNPGTPETFLTLADIAVRNGLFAEYRDCREQFVQRRLADFLAQRATIASTEIANLLPLEPTHDDQPLLQAALDEWHRRPLDDKPARTIEGVIEYALRHDLQPLDGLDYLITHPFQSDPLRARLALRSGHRNRAVDLEISSSEASPRAWRQYHVERAYDAAAEHDSAIVRTELYEAAQGGLDAEVLAAAVALQSSPAAQAELEQKYATPAGWEGLCGADLCTRATTQWYTAGPAQHVVLLSTVQTDEYAPYAEVYVDDVRVAEGPVGETTPFTIGAPRAGVHRVELRVANPLTRNLLQRRVRIAS
jgi:hypothetical protein